MTNKEACRKYDNSLKGKTVRQKYRKSKKGKEASCRGYQKYHKTNLIKIKETWRRAKLKYKYGISVDEYNKKLDAQHGLCDICFKPTLHKRLGVDHNHKTGQVRGLLCNGCNSVVGYSKESIVILQEAIRYLKKYGRLIK